jgi:integrase
LQPFATAIDKTRNIAYPVAYPEVTGWSKDMPAIELTDRFCRAVRSNETARTDYFDSIVRGLSLRVSAGARVWYLNYTKSSDGKRARLKLGIYPEMSLAAARQKARDARVAAGNGLDPIAAKRAHAASLTVSDLVENYLARHVAEKRSATEIARRLRKNVSAVVGAIKLAELHRRDITRAIDAVKDRGSPVEANRLFEDVRAMVRWARGRGDLDTNIMEGMRRPSETVERDRVLSADEVHKLWLALPNADMRDSTARVLKLCLVTGQRVGEVSAMTRSQLDLDSAIWTIPALIAKNGREHKVPLSPMAIEILIEQFEAVERLAERKARAVAEYVFPAPGGRSAVAAASVPKAVMRNGHLGIAPWTPHDLRRTAATLMAEAGVSPFIIGHVLNHASVTRATVTGRVYDRYDYGREKRVALDTLAAAIASIINRGAKLIPIGAKRHG